MKVFRRLLLAAAACLLLCAVATSAQSCGPRVRKAWRMLSDNDKRIYKGAIAAAIDKGVFVEFTKIHIHHMSEKQAHNTCAFLIWHKRFLLGFENMLRTMTPESRCVTVPYWDSMTEHAQMIGGQCKNIYDCAPIVRELSGVPTGAQQKVTVLGRAVTGHCYPGFPGYCSDDKQVCGCIPRDDLTRKPIPATSGFQSLFDQIAYSQDFETFGRNIQAGIHNDMHSQLGGFMSTFYSPNDMLFWSWHATIDMLLYVYHQCHLAEGMSADQMKRSAYAFSQDGECRYSNDAPNPLVNGELVQMSTVNGAEFKAKDNPIIGKFFQSVSAGVGDMLGFRNLGENSYMYDIPEAFKRHLLLKHELCPAFAQAVGVSPATSPPPASANTPTTKPPTQVVAASATQTPTPTPTPTPSARDFGDASGKYDPGTVHPDDPTKQGQNGGQGGGSYGSASGAGAVITAAPTTAPTAAPTTAPPTTTPPPPPAPTTAAPAPQGPPVVVQIDPGLIRVNDQDQSLQTAKYWEWAAAARQKLDKVFPGNFKEVASQLQYLECMSYKDQFGVQNYSAAFIKDFKLPENQRQPQCVKMCADVAAGKKNVVVSTSSFEARQVSIKSGVTPAPPMAIKTIGQRIVASATLAPTTKKSDAVALLPSLAVTLLAVAATVASLC